MELKNASKGKKKKEYCFSLQSPSGSESLKVFHFPAKFGIKADIFSRQQTFFTAVFFNKTWKQKQIPKGDG